VLGRPDFNEPEFATMTMTRMLGQLENAVIGTRKPVTLIGSSLGGTLAVLAASRFGARDGRYQGIGAPAKVEDRSGATVARLILLVPAVMFAKPGHHLLPEERVEAWRERGALPFFHYGYGEERLLDFSFHEDSLTHDAFGAVFDQPTLIFQGTRDDSVDYHTVETFAKTRPNVALMLLDDDHQLITSLPKIWHEVETFLGLRETRARGPASEGCAE
jgi:pimeloyl-ACP methyl ester carboxylesterase